jgi:hypothetical protein
MKPLAKVSGGRQPVEPVLPVGNDEVMTGVTNPMVHGPVAYNTLKGSEPHERPPGDGDVVR